MGLVGASLYPWCKSDHNFHFQHGMIGPTLFDVAVITGLSPLGIDILTTIKVGKGKRYHVNTFVLTYSAFIANNMGKANDPVSDDEHFVFLFYWLNVVVLCSRSI